MNNISHQSILDSVNTVFGEDGLLVRDGGHFNPTQLEYAQAVAQTLLTERDDKAPPIGMIQAATGTGKTLGYLVPALLCAQLSRSRVVVSTYTKQLQQQLYHHDAVKAAQYINELTGADITINRRFGRNNYLSTAACLAYLDHLDTTDPEAKEIHDFITDILNWSKTKKTNLVILSDYLDSTETESQDIPSGIDLSMLSIGLLSSNAEINEYKATVKIINQSDILIVNHALSVINARSWMNALDTGDRKDIHIFDEADKLEDAAYAVACKNISIRSTIKNILSGISKHSKSCLDTANETALTMLESFESAAKDRRNISASQLSIAKELLSNSAKAVIKATTDFTSNKLDFEKKLLSAEFLDAYNELSHALNLIERGASSVLSASPVQKYPRLMAGQTDPARVLSRLWNIYPQPQSSLLTEPDSSSTGIIFTSATLASRSGSFLPFCIKVGVNTKASATSLTSIHNTPTDLWLSLENKDFGSMRFVLPDQRIPVPTLGSNQRNEDDEKVYLLNPKWLTYSARMISAAQSQKGRTLVLTNSFRASKALASELEKYGVEGIIQHTKGERLNTFIADFIANDNSILISHGAWEGLNLPNTISHIVIPRIPYAPPNEGRTRLRENTLKEQGLSISKSQNIALSHSLDSVVNKLKQGVGRGIRSKSDSVQVWLADPRFPIPKSYESSFDPVLMSFPRKQRKDIIGFIPKRFIPNYNSAPLFIDGKIYEAEV